MPPHAPAIAKNKNGRGSHAPFWSCHCPKQKEGGSYAPLMLLPLPKKMEGAVMPPPDPPAIKTKQWGQSTSYHHPHPYPTTISIHTLPPSSLPMPCTYNHISIPPFPSQAPISFFHPLPPSPNGPILSPSPHIQPIPHSHL